MVRLSMLTEYLKDFLSSNTKDLKGGQEQVIRGGSFNETRDVLCTNHRTGTSEVSSRNNVAILASVWRWKPVACAPVLILS